MGRIKYTDEMIARAAAESISLSETMRRLDMPPSGGQHAHLRRRIERAGIDTSHFLGQSHGTSGKKQRKSVEELLVLTPPNSRRLEAKTLRRCLDELGVEPQCNECGLGETWNGKWIRLEVDHINEDRCDNRPENLQYLCPNCHSQKSGHPSVAELVYAQD